MSDVKMTVEFEEPLCGDDAVELLKALGFAVPSKAFIDKVKSQNPASGDPREGKRPGGGRRDRRV